VSNSLTIRPSKTHTIARLGAAIAAVSLALTGCAFEGESADDDAGASAGAAAARESEGVTITDGWVKAADEGMSAAFGELANAGPADVTVVSATTEASSMLELHETVANETGEMIMREVEGGFVIPAGGALDLEPGGNHIMLMGLTDPLEAGEEVTFTLTFSDDSTYEFTVPVKDYSGANENYVGGDGEMDMSTDSMGTDG
jgi:copper(I)-binding protein